MTTTLHMRELKGVTPDVFVSIEGSILLFWLASSAAREWVDMNVGCDRQTFGDALVVEQRYAEDIARGMAADGLVVKLALPGRH